MEIQQVATREGGVDRNNKPYLIILLSISSPPARVAWIETPASAWHLSGVWVATREGGVDRNAWAEFSVEETLTSPPARVAWIETEL